MLMLFELYYLGFGQAIASFSPNELLASLLVPVFFLFVVSFCGVVVPYAAMPSFWKKWMFHLSPFRYFLEGFLGVLTKDVPVRCATNELARFTAPDGMGCTEYVAPFVSQAGGYVETLANGECGFCQYASGEEFASGFSVLASHRWRDVGIVIAFVVFNFVVVFVCSWLFLGGARRLRSRMRK
jgi:ATP-binding cassette subfamily G (WHITE) protein 2 (SNQ2)